MFHATGRQWRTGSAVYTAEQPNLNPPFAVVTLFAPISLLPYRAACILWIGLGCVAVGASARIVARTLNWPGRHAAVAFACVLLTYPAWLVWFQGQMIWLLLYPATLAWRAMREKRHVAAGLWLGPVIALKPPLALAAFVLPWRVWISAGIGSAALTGLSVLWTGPDVWRDWWRFRDAVFWLGLPDNSSILGVVSRAKSGVLLSGGLGDVPMIARLTIAVIAIIAWWRSTRVEDPDQRFALAWLAATLCMPLGWVYYPLVGAASLIASWPASASAWLAFGIMCVPLTTLTPIMELVPATVPVVGSIYCLGTLIAWWSWTKPRRSEAVVRQSAPSDTSSARFG